MINLLVIISSITQKILIKLNVFLVRFLANISTYIVDVKRYIEMENEERNNEEEEYYPHVAARYMEEENQEMAEQREIEENNEQRQNIEEDEQQLPLVQLNHFEQIQDQYAELVEVRMLEQMSAVRRIIERQGFTNFANTIGSLISAADAESLRRRYFRRHNVNSNDGEGTSNNDDEYDSGSETIEDVSWFSGDTDEEPVYEERPDDRFFDPTITTLRNLYRYLLLYKCKRPERPYAFRPLKLMKCPYKYWCEIGEFPTARSGHRVVATESHLYSLGGYNPNRGQLRRVSCKLYQELWSYNFATKRWKLVLHPNNCDMPNELASTALIVHNNVLIVSFSYSIYSIILSLTFILRITVCY